MEAPRAPRQLHVRRRLDLHGGLRTPRLALHCGDENSAVEGWHDHAFPGWRELPIVPVRLCDVEKIGLSKAAKKWVEDHYPKSMQVVGAPVITQRSSMGTRHVPGCSPWGGYDISHTAVDASRAIEPSRRRRTLEVALERPRASATPTSIGLGD